MIAASPIHPVDLALIIIYFVVVLAIGFFVTKHTESGDDLFLAGRSLGWMAIGFSLFASNISSTTLIGLSGQAYKSGISVSNYEWMATLILVFMAIFFIPLYLKNRVSTIPEFLGRRFDTRCRKYFSLITIFLSIVVDTAGGLYAGALVLKIFFPSLVIWQVCILLALVAGLYTAGGGLKAVVYTDVIQAIVLICGCLVMTYTIFSQYDFSWSRALSAVPADHLSVIRPLDDTALPWLGTLIGVPILGFYYWSTNQYITQRILGARSLSHARWGAMLGGLLKLPVLFFMVMPGVMAIHLFPGLENPDLVFPTIITNLLPVGIIGLVLAALIAAIMSSIDSTLNSASTLIVIDFIQPKHQELSSRQIRNYGRWTTIILMVIAAAWAPQIAHFPGLFAYLQQAFSYIVPPIVAVFLFGIFWKRVSSRAAFSTLILGHSLSAIVFVLTQRGFLDIHFTIMAGILTLASSLILIVLTLTGLPEKSFEQIRTLLWQPADLRPAKKYPLYLNYQFQSLILVILTVILVVSFW